MYLNFSNFRGQTSAGGGTSLDPKTGTSVGWGGLAKFSPDGGTPQSPQEKNPGKINKPTDIRLMNLPPKYSQLYKLY